jgi:hypothetical protein
MLPFRGMANPPLYDAQLLDPVATVFTQGIRAFGTHHKALAWYDAERMLRRFQIFAGLIAAIPEERPITVNDHGCGYGALFEAFRDYPAMKHGHYHGTDISAEMVKAAAKHIRDPRASFEVSHVATRSADYSFVSGTYNMKMFASEAEWVEMVKENLRDLWSKTKVALGFNMLSTTSPYRESTLCYFDLDDILGFCRRELTANVRTTDRLEPNEFVIFAMREP